jgi:hypothetical protein
LEVYPGGKAVSLAFALDFLLAASGTGSCFVPDSVAPFAAFPLDWDRCGWHL